MSPLINKYSSTCRISFGSGQHRFLIINALGDTRITILVLQRLGTATTAQPGSLGLPRSPAIAVRCAASVAAKPVSPLLKRNLRPTIQTEMWVGRIIIPTLLTSLEKIFFEFPLGLFIAEFACLRLIHLRTSSLKRGHYIITC